MPDNKEEYKIKKEKGQGYMWQDFRHIQKLETLAIVQIHTISAVWNSELIWPDKKGKGGLTIPWWERKATWHGVCKRIITKYRYILIGFHLNQETHVSNYTMHSNSCMIFLKLQPNAIVQANCEQGIVRSQLTDSLPWNLYNRALPLNYLLSATIWL